MLHPTMSLAPVKCRQRQLQDKVFYGGYLKCRHHRHHHHQQAFVLVLVLVLILVVELFDCMACVDLNHLSLITQKHENPCRSP
jgi:hypothetical protein